MTLGAGHRVFSEIPNRVSDPYSESGSGSRRAKRTLGAGHRVVQHSQGARLRLFLLSRNIEQELGDS
jgi:hypothetical protein